MSMYNIDIMGRVEVHLPTPTYYHKYKVWQVLGAEGVKRIIDLVEEKVKQYSKDLMDEKTLERAVYRIAEDLTKELTLNTNIDTVDVYIKNSTTDGSKNYYICIGVVGNGVYVGSINFLIATYYPY